MKKLLGLVVVLMLCLSSMNSYAGKIVLVNDDHVLKDGAFGEPNDPGRFATNVASWFAGGAGTFHAYSDHWGLTGVNLATAMAEAGHAWTTGTSGFTPDLATLLSYDGIFLLDFGMDNQVLIDYVEAGGNVYVAYVGWCGTGRDERWDEFLNYFGLGRGDCHTSMNQSIPISSPHPIFAGVDNLYQMNGTNTVDLMPDDPNQEVVVTFNGHELYAVYDDSYPVWPADNEAVAAAYGSNPGTKAHSSIVNNLSYLILPIGAVMLLRMKRRRRAQ